MEIAIQQRHTDSQKEQALAVALRAIGVSSMTVNSLRRHRRFTSDDRWLDPEWLATRTALDLMGVPGIGKTGRDKLMATVNTSKPCPCCDGTGRVPWNSAA